VKVAVAGVRFFGQLLGETQSLSGHNGANGPAKQLQHAYDELGNRTQSKLPDGRSLNWLHYGSGHLHQINLQDEEGHHQLISDIERDALHREVGRSQGSVASQYEHDPMGRLTRHKASHQGKQSQAIVERQYSYDLAGQLTGRTDKQRGTQNFSYDKVGYILKATPGQGATSQAELFAFDPAGNLLETDLSKSNDPVRDNRLRFYQDLHFEYDQHGNTTKRTKGNKAAGNHTSTELIWNADHQLQESKVTRHGVTQTTAYEYDALGRRTKKTDAFGATEFLWDGDLLIQSQRGNKEALYIFEPNSFVPLATVQDGQTYWYHNDQIGAPQELTDEKGQVVWAADYKVWGEATVTQARTGTDDAPTQSTRGAWQTSQAATSSTPSIEQPFRFQGQQFDEETGLHYNRFRYYDPVVGRFASQDPIGLSGGLNVFSYAFNPVQFVDPLGWAGKRPPSGNDKSGRPLSSPHYSMWQQLTIPCHLLNGSREDHFKFANEQLHAQLQKDPSLAKGLGPDVVAHVKPGPRGGYAETSPPGLTWHHSAQDPTKIELIPRDQHRAPGPVQGTLHPNQQGGFKKLNC
jgi:RHS repeat-associated protein